MTKTTAQYIANAIQQVQRKARALYKAESVLSRVEIYIDPEKLSAATTALHNTQSELDGILRRAGFEVDYRTGQAVEIQI